MAADAATSGGAAITSVDTSALYNLSDNENLTRNEVAGTSNQKQYLSWWIYRGVLNSTLQAIFHCDDGGDSNREYVIFNTDNTIQWVSITGGSTKLALYTSRVFKDIGWYHVELLFDTTQAVASSRNIMRVNGERLTEFTTETNFPLNQTFGSMGSVGDTFRLGAYRTTSYGYDGYMAECVRIDGDPAGISTGEYDSTGLYWTPKSSTVIQELTFGNNGYYLPNEADLSSNMTTFVDSGPTAHTITTGNNTTHSPLGHKVQNSVIYVDGTTDYISVAPSGHADFTFGTGDFCIEGWFNRIALSGTSSYSYICDFRYSGGNTLRPACYMTNLNTLIYAVGSSTKITASTNAVVGTWFNVAIARSGSTTTMYLNGTSVGSFTDNTDYASGRPWFFEYPQSNAYGFKGYATELRISKGVPRHTGNFTPSTTAFVSDSNTSLLVHSDKFFGVGNDESGKYNSFNNNNSVTKSTHTPTNSSCLWSNLHPAGNASTTDGQPTFSNGNLSLTNGGTWYGTFGTLPCVGKFYYRVQVVSNGTNGRVSVGVVGKAHIDAVPSMTVNLGAYANSWVVAERHETPDIRKGNNGFTTLASSAYANGDYIDVWGDLTGGDGSGKIWFGKNGTPWEGTPEDGTGASFTNVASEVYPAIDGFTATTTTADFSTSSGTFKAINTTNIAAATSRTASDTNKYFQTTLYEGNGNGQRVGAFQPFDNTFTVAKSSLFNVLNDEYFSRTFETPTDQDVWTLSWWMKTGNLAAGRGIIGSAASNSSFIYINNVKIYIVFNGTTAFNFLLDDASQWYNIILTCNGSTLTCYVNGVSRGTASVAMNDFNSAVAHTIGSYNGDESHFDGYMADFIFVDGTVHSTSVFGQTDTSTNRWIPKDPTITLDEASDFGNNGFYLNFADSSALGDDISGNNHDFTNNNTVTQSTDSPTTNFAVLDASQPAWTSAVTLSAGNLTFAGSAASIWNNVTATLPMTTGKWIVATKPNVVEEGSANIILVNEVASRSDADTRSSVGVWGFSGGGTFATPSGSAVKLYNGDGSAETNVNTGVTLTTSDYNLLCVDVDNKLYWIGYYDDSADETKWYNGSSGWDGNPAAGTGGIIINGNTFKFGIATYASRGGIIDFGQGTLLSEITVPTGFSYLKQDNLAGTDQFISAFSWIKNRDEVHNHMLFDRVRGATKDLHSNVTDAQVTNVNTVQSFLEAGVQVGSDDQVNKASNSFVLWNWMMEATGTGASNEDGSINTTSTLVDTTLGMSISTYTGTGSNATVGHGLGVIPEYMIVKRLNAAFQWDVYHSSLGATKHLVLNSNGGPQTTSTVWNNTTPTSSVFSIGSDGAVNASGGTYVAYCFTPSQFNSIGSYVGNGGADGPFVSLVNSLGISLMPRFIIIKALSTPHWSMYDSIRDFSGTAPSSIINEGNPWRGLLYPNLTNADNSTASNMDGCTGGLKILSAGSNYVNQSGVTYVYMAVGTPIIDTDGRIIAGR